MNAVARKSKKWGESVELGVAINQGVPITGISNIHREQADLLAAMNIRKPVPDAQLSLL